MLFVENFLTAHKCCMINTIDKTDIKICYDLIRALRFVHDKDHDSKHGANRDSGNGAYSNSFGRLFKIIKDSIYLIQINPVL